MTEVSLDRAVRLLAGQPCVRGQRHFDDGARDHSAGSFIHAPAQSWHLPSSTTGCGLLVLRLRGRRTTVGHPGEAGARAESAPELQVTAFQLANTLGATVGGAVLDAYGVRSELLIGAAFALVAGWAFAAIRPAPGSAAPCGTGPRLQEGKS